MAVLILVTTIMGFVLLLLAPHDSSSRIVASRGLQLSKLGKLLASTVTTSSATIRRHPRGHRYYDYWQDEEHEDFEPYPWTFAKRPSNGNNSKKKNDNKNGNNSNNHELKQQNPVEALDDEPYVPDPTTTQNIIKAKQEETIFNDRSPFYAQLRQSYESFFPPPLPSSKRNDEDIHIISKSSIDPNAKRALQAVEDLQTYTNLQTHLPASNPNANPNTNPNDSNNSNSINHNLYYDIHNCPDEPPPGYPIEWNLLHDVLGQWPADDPELPASGTLYQGLCVFDLQSQSQQTNGNNNNYAKAIAYRNAEVPFVVRGDVPVAQTVERWNAPHYLEALLGDLPQGTETSESGKFTYWTGSGVDSHKYTIVDSSTSADNVNANAKYYKAPTELTEMTFAEWIQLANVTDPKLLAPESPHYYLRVVGCAPGKKPRVDNYRGGNVNVDNSCSRLAGNAKHVPYLADELPFYTQTESSLYIKEPLADKIARNYNGIDVMFGGAGASSKALNCRFGMKGVMTTNHFDGERNFVTVLSGERRYVLARPHQCGNMALYPYGHPSARHSAVDWANPDLQEHPKFEQAKGNEVVLQAGDSLFLPSLWFHYIVSMSTNVQCNTRSGMDQRRVQELDDSCGW